MLKLYTIVIICVLLIPKSVLAQEKRKATDIIVIDERNDEAKIKIAGATLEVSEQNDTVAKITIGRRTWEFIEQGDKTHVRIVKNPRNYFKGHWAGVNMGFCNYAVSDESDFMNLNAGKSMFVGINFLQYNIGLQKNKTNLGLVTGMGWTVYNYRLDNNYLVMQNDDGITIGDPVIDKDIKKSKIVSSYINIPLLFEVQSVDESNRNAFISAGVYGGFRLGSHTKTVYYGGDKQKSRQDININPIQYGLMFQIGFEFIKLYGTYNLSTLYEADKGPEVNPYTIGITLANF